MGIVVADPFGIRLVGGFGEGEVVACIGGWSLDYRRLTVWMMME